MENTGLIIIARKTASMAAAVLALLAAGPVTGADLLDVYQQALREDAQYQAARADYRAAREARPQARASLLPQISLSASRADVDRETTTEGQGTSSIDIDEQTHALELRQALFDWSDFAGVSRADAEVAQAEAELARAKQDLIIRTAEAYFGVLTAAESLRFAKAEKRAVERQLDQARERFEVGLLPITDVKEAQASFDLTVSREIEARNELDDAREALRTIIGRPPGILAGAVDGFPLEFPQPADTNAWVSRALEQNPDYLAARSAAEAARHGMRVARGGHYPELDLVVSRSNRESAFTSLGDPVDTEDTSDRIGFELTWNIFSGGATFSESEQARAQFQAAQSRVVQARRETEQISRDAFRAIEANVAQVRALRQAVESSRSRVESTRTGFKVGTRTAVDVLNALRDLFEAERDLSGARHDYLLSRLRLKQAAGTLTIDDVRAVNAWLNDAQPAGGAS